jgi:hypothetical protein
MSLSLGSEILSGEWVMPRFSRWQLILKQRLVVWFPRTTRECFLYGFRWKGIFIGVVRRGEEVDPRQEVYYERVRRLTEVLQKDDEMSITLLDQQNSDNEEGEKNSPGAIGAGQHERADALVTA